MDQSASQSQTQPKQTIAISRTDRWQACYRLQELDIPCTCLTDGQLQVEVCTPIAAMQIWSVTRQLTSSRQQLADWLERCWQAF